MDELNSWITSLNQCEVEVHDRKENSGLEISVLGNDPFLHFDENFNEYLKTSVAAMTFERWKWVGYGALFAVVLFFMPYLWRKIINDCKNSDSVLNAKMKNTNIDLVRIFAALMILTVHVGICAGFDFTTGAKGVQLFLY